MKSLKEILWSVGHTADFYFTDITDVNHKNALGDTPLHVVCGRGDAAAVNILIQAGANVNAKGEYGMTPLFSAVAGRSVESVRILLDAGADPLMKSAGFHPDNNPLYYAKLADAAKDDPDSKRLVDLLEKATREAESRCS